MQARNRGLTVGGVCSLLLTVATAGCNDGGAIPPELTESVTSALSAAVSGVITDSIGRPLSGVTVVLSGQQQATVTTGLTGTFSFPISTPGTTASVSVMPTKGGCTFNPSVVN